MNVTVRVPMTPEQAIAEIERRRERSRNYMRERSRQIKELAIQGGLVMGPQRRKNATAAAPAPAVQA